MTDSINQRQAQALAELIHAVIHDYVVEEERAGTRMLLNDILSSVCHVMGGLLASIPESHRDQVYGDMGMMVKMSMGLYLKERGTGSVLAVDVRDLNDNDSKRTMQ